MMAKVAFLFTSLFLLVTVCSGLIAAELHVAPPPLGNNKNPGTKASPFATIQKGMNAATDGDTVIVAKGTYVENVNFNGKNVVLRSTDSTDWTVVKETVIDGNQAGSVVTFLGPEDETCVLAGFTIRNGTGTFLGSDGFCGGGILGDVDLATMPRITIRNNIITGNSAQNGGGIVWCAGVIQNCIITGNRSTGTSGPNWCGGGIGFCNGIIQNNLIAGNVAPCGGAISFSNADFRNNVVVGNAAPGNHGGGLAHLGTSQYSPPGGSLSNCIIWGNTSPTGPQVHDSVAPSHCCIQDWTGGGSNIAADPRFMDEDGPDDNINTYEDNDYRLTSMSPCIDQGNNEDWMWETVDLDGNPRIWRGKDSLTVDMGAYEYGSYPFEITGLVKPPDGGAELTWDSRSGDSYIIWWCSDPSTPKAWTRKKDPIPSGGDKTSWSDPDTTSTRKFYRIELQ